MRIIPWVDASSLGTTVANVGYVLLQATIWQKNKQTNKQKTVRQCCGTCTFGNMNKQITLSVHHHHHIILPLCDYLHRIIRLMFTHAVLHSALLHLSPPKETEIGPLFIYALQVTCKLKQWSNHCVLFIALHSLHFSLCIACHATIFGWKPPPLNATQLEMEMFKLHKFSTNVKPYPTHAQCVWIVQCTGARIGPSWVKKTHLDKPVCWTFISRVCFYSLSLTIISKMYSQFANNHTNAHSHLYPA